MPTASAGLRGGNNAAAAAAATLHYKKTSSSFSTLPPFPSSIHHFRPHHRPTCTSANNAAFTLSQQKASRPLPAGPGPLDKHGKKLEAFSVSLPVGKKSKNRAASAPHSGKKTGSTRGVAGPVKADHNAVTTTRYFSAAEEPERSAKSTAVVVKRSSRSGFHPVVGSGSTNSSTIGSGPSAIRRSSSLSSLCINDGVNPSPPATTANAKPTAHYNRNASSGGSSSTSGGGQRKNQMDDGGANARQVSGGETWGRKGGGAGGGARYGSGPSTSGTGAGVSGRYGGGTTAGTAGAAREEASSSSRFSAHSSSSSSSTNGKGKDREGGRIGLRNLGNTCFMNSVLQCLSNTHPLLEWCLSDHFIADINTTTSSMRGTLVRAFASLMKSLWSESGSGSYVSPDSFKTHIQTFAPRFMGYSQQDSQEFLRYLLEGIHEDVNRIKVKSKPVTLDDNRLDNKSDRDKAKEYWNAYLTRDSSHIVDIFVGQLKSELKFVDCGHRSVTFDPFWDLSLPIPKSGLDQSLDNCLRMFMKEEELEAEERPMCTKCKMRRSCTKSFSIQRFPRILVFHLKRFSQERYGRKLSTLVDFPVKGLDLSDYSSDGGQKVTYDLYAVSNHSGGVHSGHYTATCRNPYTGEWFSFNDQRVSGARCNQAVSSEAYLLFYELTTPSKRS